MLAARADSVWEVSSSRNTMVIGTGGGNVVVFCRGVLCCVVSCRVVWYCVVLCYVVLCSGCIVL